MNTESVTLLVEGCRHILRISKPVEIRMRSNGAGAYKMCAGYAHLPRSKNPRKHVVVINLDIVRAAKWDISSIIAHELIHCSQMEHRILGKKHHDERFQNMAEILRKGLRKIGVSVKKKELYNPKTDTE
jgi:hypothetical protein